MVMVMSEAQGGGSAIVCFWIYPAHARSSEVHQRSAAHQHRVLVL